MKDLSQRRAQLPKIRGALSGPVFDGLHLNNLQVPREPQQHDYRAQQASYILADARYEFQTGASASCRTSRDGSEQQGLRRRRATPSPAAFQRPAACGVIKHGCRPLCLSVDGSSRPLLPFLFNCTALCSSRLVLDLKSLNICQQPHALRIYLARK